MKIRNVLACLAAALLLVSTFAWQANQDRPPRAQVEIGPLSVAEAPAGS